MVIERINLFLSLQNSRISGQNTKSFRRRHSQRGEEGDKLTNRLKTLALCFINFTFGFNNSYESWGCGVSEVGCNNEYRFQYETVSKIQTL